MRRAAEPSIAKGSGTFGATAVLLVLWILPTVGFAALVFQRGWVAGSLVVLGAPIIFLTGAFVVSRMLPSRLPPLEDTNWIRAFLNAAICVLGVLAVLHFSAVGVPLLSSSVETSRFDVGSSGLGGFPSRAVLYGLPIAALVGLATLQQATWRPALALWGLFAVTQVFLGFKGGLLEVVTISALGLAIRYGRLGVKQLLLIGGGLGIAMGYVTFVGSLYKTMAASDAGFAYIIRRSTSDAIIAGYVALTARPYGIPEGTSVFVHDIGALLGRYLGTAPDGYTFDELVSSVVTGTPIQRGAFLVPVTVGGPIYLLYSLPIVAAVIALLAIGVWWRSSILTLRRPGGAASALFAAVVIYGLRVFLMNGNGAYLLINLTFTFGLLLACAWLGTAIDGARGVNRRTAPRGARRGTVRIGPTPHARVGESSDRASDATGGAVAHWLPGVTKVSP